MPTFGAVLTPWYENDDEIGKKNNHAPKVRNQKKNILTNTVQSLLGKELSENSNNSRGK